MSPRRAAECPGGRRSDPRALQTPPAASEPVVPRDARGRHPRATESPAGRRGPEALSHRAGTAPGGGRAPPAAAASAVAVTPGTPTPSTEPGTPATPGQRRHTRSGTCHDTIAKRLALPHPLHGGPLRRLNRDGRAGFRRHTRDGRDSFRHDRRHQPIVDSRRLFSKPGYHIRRRATRPASAPSSAWRLADLPLRTQFQDV